MYSLLGWYSLTPGVFLLSPPPFWSVFLLPFLSHSLSKNVLSSHVASPPWSPITVSISKRPRLSARCLEAFKTWRGVLPGICSLKSGSNNSAEMKGLQGRDGLRGTATLFFLMRTLGGKTREILPRPSPSRVYL